MQLQKMPGWQAMQLADAPEISRFTLLYDTEVVEPMRIGAGLPNLRHIGFLPDRASLPFHFGSKKPGWKEFGMLGSRPRSEVTQGGIQASTFAWVLLFEWNPLRSAWDAFIDAQDTLQPQLLSLTPDFLLPCIFLTRMAPLPFMLGETSRAAEWLPCFASAQSRLSPLLISFFVAWLRGNSKSATRYRAATGPAPDYTKEQRDAQMLWKETFGQEFLQRVLAAERVEPTILRGIEAASSQLWTDRSLSIPPRAMPLVSGLLPIYCWQEQPAIAKSLDAGALSSLNTLTQQWKAFLKQTQRED